MKPRRTDTPRRASAAQLPALASPARLEIVGALQAHGPLGVRALAAHLTRPMDGLYHHLRVLQRVGVVRVAETRRAGKRDEAVYGLTAERLGHELPPRTPAMKQA